MKNNTLSFFSIPLLLCTLIICISCKENSKETKEEPMTEEQLIAKAKEIHQRVITLDTHCDINVSNFTDSINYTQELETQITLPKMNEGGLDVAWFIVYTGQDTLTNEGYVKAYDNAISKFDAIHKLTEEIAPDQIELATTSNEVREIHKKGKKVAVIGNQMKLDLFKDENPINKTILLNNNINFQVVGVYTDPGGNREESRLFIPLSTAQQVFNAGDDIRSIAYTVKMSDNFDEAVDLSMAMSQAIDQDLRSRFAVAPDDRAAVRVDNTLEQAQKIYGLIDTIRAVFWFIGIGTIIAGIVGVSNIMLIIVKERTKEIGIRKALGALPSQITGMILQEAIFITAIAGFIGLFAGVLAMEAISPLVETDFLKYPKADLRTSLTTVILLIVAGAIAGYIPARRAANIKPIEALRDE